MIKSGRPWWACPAWTYARWGRPPEWTVPPSADAARGSAPLPSTTLTANATTKLNINLIFCQPPTTGSLPETELYIQAPSFSTQKYLKTGGLQRGLTAGNRQALTGRFPQKRRHFFRSSRWRLSRPPAGRSRAPCPPAGSGRPLRPAPSARRMAARRSGTTSTAPVRPIPSRMLAMMARLLRSGVT